MDQKCSRHMTKCFWGLMIWGAFLSTVWAQAPAPPGGSQAPAASKPPAPTFSAPESPDTVVLKVGDQKFTKAEFDLLIENMVPPQEQRSLALQGKKMLGERFALMVELAQQAHVNHLDQTPAYLHKLAIQEEQLAAQAEAQEINNQSKPTPEEINKYFTEHSNDYDEVTLRQAVVRIKPANPPAPQGTTPPPAATGLSPEEAKTRADAIRKELLVGTDIKKVMDDFKAPGEVIIEQEPRKVRHGGMRADLEKVAFTLKDGEVSEPLAIPQALVLLQVTGHSHQDLKDASPDIERKLQREKAEAAIAAVKSATTVWYDDQYFAPPAKPAEAPRTGAAAPSAPTPIVPVAAPPAPAAPPKP